MPANRVYVCRWVELPDGGYRGTVAAPRVEVEADTFGALVREATEAVAGAAGDPEPAFDFEPPPPNAGKAAWFADGLVALAPQSHFQSDETIGLTTGGACPRCHWPLGERTDRPVAVRSAWPGEVIFSWHSAAEGVRLLLVSERFLGLLSDEDRSTFTLRPATVPPGKRKRYVEVVPKRFVPEVAVAGLEQTGWRCDQCGRACVGHGRDLGWSVPAVGRDSIPPTPTFFIGTSTSYRLCLTGPRWEALKGPMRKSGMTSDPIAAVRPVQVARRIEVPEIEQARRRVVGGD